MTVDVAARRPYFGYCFKMDFCLRQNLRSDINYALREMESRRLERIGGALGLTDRNFVN